MKKPGSGANPSFAADPGFLTGQQALQVLPVFADQGHRDDADHSYLRIRPVWQQEYRGPARRREWTGQRGIAKAMATNSQITARRLSSGSSLTATPALGGDAPAALNFRREDRRDG